MKKMKLKIKGKSAERAATEIVLGLILVAYDQKEMTKQEVIDAIFGLME